MTKDVLVTISGLQFIPEGTEPPEPVEVTCPGTYYKKNGKHYVMYEEIIDGFSEVTKNTLKLHPSVFYLPAVPLSESVFHPCRQHEFLLYL